MWRAGLLRGVVSVEPRDQHFGFEMLGNRASENGWLAGGLSPPRVNLTGLGVTNAVARPLILPDTFVPLTIPV